jgi:hypothetical protein
VVLGVTANTLEASVDPKPTSSTTEKVHFKPFTGVAENSNLAPRHIQHGRKILSFESISARIGRKLLDTFADSLLHVNRLYNKAFGFEARKVPAHSAHLIDKDVMAELQGRFPQEWDATSSHKFRSPSDMQFAFSYYYFLFHEKEDVQIEEIFDMFDSDASG